MTLGRRWGLNCHSFHLHAFICYTSRVSCFNEAFQLARPLALSIDVGAYYLNLLWNWYAQPGLYRPDALLDDPLIFGAANLLV